MRLKISIYFIILLGPFLIIIGCKKPITIKEIASNPMQYESQIVKVRGEVIKSNAIIGLGYFELSDGDAQIIVFSKSGVPIEGEKVSVQGKVSQYLKLGTIQVVGIESTEISH